MLIPSTPSSLPGTPQWPTRFWPAAMPVEVGATPRSLATPRLRRSARHAKQTMCSPSRDERPTLNGRIALSFTTTFSALGGMGRLHPVPDREARMERLAWTFARHGMDFVGVVFMEFCYFADCRNLTDIETNNLYCRFYL